MAKQADFLRGESDGFCHGERRKGSLLEADVDVLDAQGTRARTIGSLGSRHGEDQQPMTVNKTLVLAKEKPRINALPAMAAAAGRWRRDGRCFRIRCRILTLAEEEPLASFAQGRG